MNFDSTKCTGGSLVARLKRMGIEFSETELTTSLAAAISLCQARSLRPLLLLSDSAREDFASLPSPTADEVANAVVVGLAPQLLNYEQLNTAFRILEQQPDAPLIATHKALYYKDDDGQLSLGPGGFVSALEAASKKEAIVVGKPEEGFFRACLESFEGLSEEDWHDVAIVRPFSSRRCARSAMRRSATMYGMI